ncbi:MAG: PKD domain-containing protein [Geothermobacteraceae bacterium]
MARLFNGPAGTSSYDAANAKFDEVSSNDWTIFSFGTLGTDANGNGVDDAVENFQKKVDLSLAGNIMDCGECHVGGGAMEYVPFSDLTARIPLRELQVNTPVPAGNSVQSKLLSGEVTAFNYFIDNYDADGDGDKLEALPIDYANAGVMEVDCFICHLDGYDYGKRREVLREARLDATRVVGAGIGTESDLPYGDTGFGTLVDYNANVQVAAGGETVGKYSHTEALSAGQLYLPESFFTNLKEKPAAENCANCHQNHGSVDWKKRGDNWIADANYEVHYNLGCLGCHERNDGWEDPVTHKPNPEQGAGVLGHDPAKGDAPYSSLYNANDKAAFKDCASCHLANADGGQSYGAPDPTAAHQAKGLTAALVTDAAGNKVGHVDLFDCASCHARRISNDPHNTGGVLVDATGPDLEGRLADHENELVDRNNMQDQTLLSWYKGKLLRSSLLTTVFLRDKNDTSFDGNMDGRGGGMDALLQTQVLATGLNLGVGPLTEQALAAGADVNGDYHVTGTMISNFMTRLKTDVETWVGKTGASLFYSTMGVPFKVNHGISPADQAWGAGGCADCHGADKGFYNGAIKTISDNLAWDDSSYYTPFTMANAMTQPTDVHPNVKDKVGKRSIAVQYGNAGMRAIDRSEMLYEGTFMTQADFAAEYTGSTVAGWYLSNGKPDPLTVDNGTAGWLFKVQVKSDADGSVITRTKMLGTGTAVYTPDADPTPAERIAALLTAMTAGFTGNDGGDGVCDPGDATFEFCIVDGGANNLKIIAKSGYTVRLHPQSTVGGKHFNIANATWKANPLTPALPAVFATVDSDSDGLIDGRAEMVAYLNAITAADAGIGVDPQAAISAPAGNEVEVDTAVTFSADTSLNTQGSFTYTWDFNDGTPDETGASVQHTFTTVGSYQVALRVTDEEGKSDVEVKTITVKAPAPPADISLAAPVTAGSAANVVFANLGPFTRLIIYWGDGSRSIDNTGGTDTITIQHTYTTPGNKLVKVLVYDGRSRTGIKSGTITID